MYYQKINLVGFLLFSLLTQLEFHSEIYLLQQKLQV